MKSKELVSKTDIPAGASADAIRNQKRKLLEITFAQIDKQYGPGSAMFLGASNVKPHEVVSSGSMLLDAALGGGYPTGRIVEVFGPEASGKTTITLHAIAEVQRKGGICAFIDAEHALDPNYARQLGVNVDEMIISQPDFGEQALDIAEHLIRSGAVDLVVVDSVAALVPKNELEGDMGDVHMGLQARLMSQALRKLTPVIHKSKAVLMFINQTRSTMNTMPFAAKETTTGGNALKFYASLRLEVRRISSIKRGDVNVGNNVAVKVVKNKMAPPFKRVELVLLFGTGISKEHDLLDSALAYGIITQTGSWFSFQGQKFAQGREQATAHLKDQHDVASSVRAACIAAAAVSAAVVPNDVENENHDNQTEE